MAEPLYECLKRDGYDDPTRKVVSAILTAAAIGSAAYNAYRAVSIAMDEFDIAEQYWDLANNWLNYYKDFYVPVEDQELAEARALTDEEPEYLVARGRARAAVWGAFQHLIPQAIKRTSRYCTGKRQQAIQQLTTAQANALALADGLGYRNERAYALTRSDERFKRQLETAKRGRNMSASIVSFGAAAAGIYGQLYDQAWEGLKGAGTFLGYQLNRETPAYPSVSQAFEHTHAQEVIEEAIRPGQAFEQYQRG